MSGLSRDDEHFRNALLKRQSEGKELTESEDLWLSVLNDRYEKFLDEGLQAMKSQLPSSKGGASFASQTAASIGNSVTGFFSKIGKISKFASLDNQKGSSGGGGTNNNDNEFDYDVAEENEGLSYSGAKGLPHEKSKHWSWIRPHFVVGAVPLADQSVTDPSAHIRGLRAQCKEKNLKVTLVVSCIDVLQELARPGERLENFAKPRDWEAMLGVHSFVELALPEDPCDVVDVSPADTLSVCRMMNDVMNAGRVVFLHCKAGKFRVWCIAMCFLVTQRNLSFDQAQELLRKQRPWMTGGAMHALYVQQVADYAKSNPLTASSPMLPVAGISNTSFSSQRSGAGSGGGGGKSPSTLSPASASPVPSPLTLDSKNASPSNNNINTSNKNNSSAAAAAASIAATTEITAKLEQVGNEAKTQEEAEEARYKVILAELLQLSPNYRTRVVEDLAKLT